MRKVFFSILLIFSLSSNAQDVRALAQEAINFERTQKEDQAYDKYKEVLAADPNNIQAMLRSSELCASIGGRKTDKKEKAAYYNLSNQYADQALAINPNNADANYVKAMACGKLTEVEDENKKLVALVKDIRTYGDRALAINPRHGKANYVIGKWHYEMVNLSWTKKAAVKVLFGGLQPASLDSAYIYMERCRTLEPYFVRNFYDLAKAYKEDHRPAKAIEVLNQLVKLPTRTADDQALKAEGKTMLSEMQ